MGTKELSIKLMIDTNAHKVCFAEANSEVVEFLAALLSLPLGTVINPLTKENMIGSINNVLDSVEKLNANYKSEQPRLSPSVGPTALQHLQQLFSLYYLSNAPSNGPYGATARATSVPMATYTIGDDLSVSPASFFTTISLLGLPQLAQCGVKDLSTLQEKIMKMGQKEVGGVLQFLPGGLNR